MNNKRPWLASVLLVLAASAVISLCSADSWPLPKSVRYCSQNEKFCVKIVPKSLSSQLDYFKDTVEGKDDPGGVKGVKDNWPRATLLQRQGRRYKPLRTFRLVNEVSPVTALVSYDGRFVVTFDNWHSLGYGPDAVVIYQADGTLVRSFGLDAFLSREEIGSLPHSVSSIHWSGDHFIRDDGSALVLRVVKPSCEVRYSSEDRDFFDVEVDLASGELLEPQRPEWIRLGVVMTDPASTDVADEEPSFFSELDRKPVRVTPSHLQEQLLESPMPEYTSIAKKARIRGTVLLDVLVSENGEVEHVKVVKGLPMGLDQASVDSLRQWRFKPFQSEGVPTPAVGRIALTFQCVDQTMGAMP